ncbi:MAG TPA: EAL domain-containing protein [Desulfuromonadales bacterium]|nr:EAL domain-containing protein [Desulfuromonadales bacterium]
MNRLNVTHTTTLPETLGLPQRLLIVDDEPLMRSSIRLQLDGAGLEISECGTGCGAIEALESGEFDLVLLDIKLPDISGLEVMEWIVVNNIQTSVIFVSATDSIDSAILALRKGAIEFVRKPEDLADLKHKVNSALYRRRLERSNAVMAARLEHSELIHRFLVDNSPDLIYILDDRARFTFINSRFETLLGYTHDELIGCSYSTIVFEDDVEKALYAFNERRRDGRATANLEIRLKCKDNHYFHFENNLMVSMLAATGIYSDVRDNHPPAQQQYLGTYGVAHNINERKLAEEAIAYQAFHDHLTSLPNQRLFKDRLEMTIIHAKRFRRMVGVMFIDLDRFKLVNDTYGHTVGDELLRNVASRLRLCMRAGDTLARKGGDEFTALLPDLVKTEDATIVAEKIINDFTMPFSVCGQDMYITASIGIAVLPGDGEDVDVLLRNADIAMYKVKSSGKNGFKYYIPDMNVAKHERITLENDLRLAIRRNEFELLYQPQFNVSKNELVGVEALIRWNHPKKGLMSPYAFINLAEEAGLISAITNWVLDTACRQLSLWRTAGFNSLRMSVNVSPQEFVLENFVERILPYVTRYNLVPDSLEIEITENILLQDAPDIIAKMKKLRRHGIRIAIDDFGTCYSSLNYLRLFPANTIKIDQSFVRDLFNEHSASPIIQAIIGIANGYGLHLLAEGVETAEQAKALKDIGCYEMQGFFFSKPLRVEEMERLLCSASSDASFFKL